MITATNSRTERRPLDRLAAAAQEYANAVKMAKFMRKRGKGIAEQDKRVKEKLDKLQQIRAELTR